MSAESPRTILIATDSDAVFEEVDGALVDSRTRVLRVKQGQHVIRAIQEVDPDIVLLDSQVGTMGGVAIALEIRNDESDDRVPPQSILILLDRRADVWLTQQTTADGYLIKPLDSLRIAKAVNAVLDGEYFADDTPLIAAQLDRPYVEPVEDAETDAESSAVEAETEDVA